MNKIQINIPEGFETNQDILDLAKILTLEYP